MFDNVKIGDVLNMDNFSNTFTVLAIGELTLWGFYPAKSGKLAPHVFSKETGRSLSDPYLRLLIPINPLDIWNDLPMYVREAVIVMAKANKKISAIKFLRGYRNAYGDIDGLLEMKLVYEAGVEATPGWPFD